MTNEAGADKQSSLGAWLFYVTFVVLLLTEAAIVKGILWGADKAHLHPFGPWIAWALFVTGGVVLSGIELKHTIPGQKMRDPILRYCCWLQRRFGFTGYMVNTIIFAPLATAAALRQTDNPNQKALSWLSALLWASIFVLAVTLIWG